MSENNILKARIQHLHKTEAEWIIFEQEKPELAVFNEGELIIFDTDESHTTPRLKVGDGIHKLSELPFIVSTNTNIENLEIIDAGRITDYSDYQ